MKAPSSDEHVTYSTAEFGTQALSPHAKQTVAPTAMLLALSVSLVLVGLAVASVNLHVQDSDFLSMKAQIPVLSRVSTGAQTEVISV